MHVKINFLIIINFFSIDFKLFKFLQIINFFIYKYYSETIYLIVFNIKK